MKTIFITNPVQPKSLTHRITAWVMSFIMLAQICVPGIAAAAQIISDDLLAKNLVNPGFQYARGNQFLYEKAPFVDAINLQHSSIETFHRRLLDAKVALPAPTYIPIAGDITIFIPHYPVGKLVGDAYVQNRFIRQQIFNLLGRHFIDISLDADEITQINRLYQNAFTFASAQNMFKYGDRLTAAQSINADMIWPERRDINGQSVTVPVLYLSDATIEKRAVNDHVTEFNGQVNTFNSVTLDHTSLRLGRNNFLTTLGHFVNNGGTINAAGDLNLNVGGVLANQSGVINVQGNLDIITAQLSNKTVVHRFTDRYGQGTRLGQIAGINANSITINSANDIIFEGATATAVNGGITMEAGGNIQILPVTTQYVGNTRDGHWEVTSSNLDVLGSRLSANETLKLIADGKIEITASELISTQGGIELLANQGIYIVDELTQEQIQKIDRKGKTTGQSSEFRTEAVRAVLSAGKGVLLDSAHGDVTLKATKITSGEGAQVNAHDGKVHLLMTKELEDKHLQTVRKGTWTIKTRTEDITHETNLQNAIVGGLQVQAMYGINVEYTGKPGATLREQIEEYRNMPGMEWMAQLYDQSLTTAGGNVDWNALEEIHKELKKSKTNLSPAAMAIIAICVAVAMGPAAASLNSVVSGATASALGGGAIATSIGSLAGAAMAAGATTIATQAAQSLASGNNLRETLNSLDSKENLKALAASMATAGMMNATGADKLMLFDVPKDSGISLASIGNQAVQAVASATVSAGVSVSIYGGNSDDYKKSFRQNLATHAINQLGEHMAGKIGKAFDGGDSLDTALKYISHAGSGCIIGAATAKATNDSESQGACYSGAGGAVIGELIGSRYRTSDEVQDAKNALDGFIKENGEIVRLLRAEGKTNQQIIETLRSSTDFLVMEDRLNQLKQTGVDLSKLGAALGAFAAGAEASQINIAADIGASVAENNALSLYGSFEVMMDAIDSIEKGGARFLGAVSGASLSIAIMLKDTAILLHDLEGAKTYIQTGGLLGSKESYDKIVQLFAGVTELAAHPIDTINIISTFYKKELDGAATEYNDGNNFTAGVVVGKNLFDIYSIVRAIPETAVLANKLKAANNVVANWGTGPLRPPIRTLLENEGVLINSSHGLQSRTSGLFENVQFGQHGEVTTKYLYTIDERGINVVLEKTPFPTPRGNVVHTNLSSSASIGGEVWFGSNNTVTINAGSGRFGDAVGVTKQQWEATVRLWESLGYKVNPIPIGKR